MKVIDVEAHFDGDFQEDAYLKANGWTTFQEAGHPDDYDETTYKTVTDLGEGRLKAMDEAGVDCAHISLTTPSAEWFDVETGKKVATESNNVLAAAIQKNPDRLGGYISLVPGDVEWSLKEIDRCLAMGLWGWNTMSNYNGERLDDQKYWPLLERCAELGMPVYLHPMFPANPELNEYGTALNGPAFGFTYDTQYTFLRLVCAGAFEKYPNLKMILGHDAEGLAFFIDRVDAAYRQGYGQPPEDKGYLAHEPSYYLKKNLYGSTSGNFLPEAMLLTNKVLGKGRLTLGSDYPYEDLAKSVALVRDDPTLSSEDKADILYRNAEAMGLGRCHTENIK